MIEQCLNQTDRSNIKGWLNKVVANYMVKNPLELGQIEHCIHYFESTTDKDKDLTNIGVKQAIRKAEKWVERLNSQATKDAETEEDIERTLELGEGFVFVRLLSQDAYQREGKLMSHCVASYYGNDTVEIYSLRDSFNKPHCTIEIVKNAGSVNQIKGKGNGEIHPKYIKHVLAFLDSINLPVQSSEMSYLGYTLLEGPNLKAYQEIKTLFSGFKELTYGGNFFLYKHSKPEVLK